MTQTRYDVLAIGNAIVDVISDADDAFIAAQNLNKGGMTLIDADRAQSLYEAMGPGREISGGSAANTLAGLSRLGTRPRSLVRWRRTNWATSSRMIFVQPVSTLMCPHVPASRRPRAA